MHRDDRNPILDISADIAHPDNFNKLTLEQLISKIKKYQSIMIEGETIPVSALQINQDIPKGHKLTKIQSVSKRGTKIEYGVLFQNKSVPGTLATLTTIPLNIQTFLGTEEKTLGEFLNARQQLPPEGKVVISIASNSKEYTEIRNDKIQITQAIKRDSGFHSFHVRNIYKEGQQIKYSALDHTGGILIGGVLATILP